MGAGSRMISSCITVIRPAPNREAFIAGAVKSAVRSPGYGFEKRAAEEDERVGVVFD